MKLKSETYVATVSNRLLRKGVEISKIRSKWVVKYDKIDKYIYFSDIDIKTMIYYGHIITIDEYNKDLLKNKISIDKVIKVVSNCTNIKYELIIKRSRKREIIRARQLLQYFLYDIKQLKLSLAEIGILTSDSSPYNHATVLHNIEVIENDINYDIILKTQFEEINKML